MDIMELGALGELVGGVAVVASLIYLALQVKQNTRQVYEQSRSQRQVSLNEVAKRFTDFRRMITASREIASIWSSGRRSIEDLDAPARAQFDFLLVEMFWAWAMLVLYRQEDTIDEAVVDLTMENLPLYAGSPGIEMWWRTTEYRSEYPDDFRRLVDDFYGGQSAVGS